jgi:hypothetical protein
MAESKNCKGCSATVHQSFDEIRANMDEYTRTIDTDLRTDPALYKKRLLRCSSCAGLYYETTCRYCGCFVQMRALRKNLDCPNPEGSRWHKL